MQSNARAGVGVLIFRNDGKEILIGERKSLIGTGSWQNPGGNIRYMEHPFEAAKRELKEETGLTALKMRKGPWVNTIYKVTYPSLLTDVIHYIGTFVIVDEYEGEIQNLKPKENGDWKWVSIDELPNEEDLFLPLKWLVKEHKLADLAKAN